MNQFFTGDLAAINDAAIAAESVKNADRAQTLAYNLGLLQQFNNAQGMRSNERIAKTGADANVEVANVNAAARNNESWRQMATQLQIAAFHNDRAREANALQEQQFGVVNQQERDRLALEREKIAATAAALDKQLASAKEIAGIQAGVLNPRVMDEVIKNLPSASAADATAGAAVDAANRGMKPSALRTAITSKASLLGGVPAVLGRFVSPTPDPDAIMSNMPPEQQAMVRFDPESRTFVPRMNNQAALFALLGQSRKPAAASTNAPAGAAPAVPLPAGGGFYPGFGYQLPTQAAPAPQSSFAAQFAEELRKYKANKKN